MVNDRQPIPDAPSRGLFLPLSAFRPALWLALALALGYGSSLGAIAHAQSILLPGITESDDGTSDGDETSDPEAPARDEAEGSPDADGGSDGLDADAIEGSLEEDGEIVDLEGELEPELEPELDAELEPELDAELEPELDAELEPELELDEPLETEAIIDAAEDAQDLDIDLPTPPTLEEIEGDINLPSDGESPAILDRIPDAGGADGINLDVIRPDPGTFNPAVPGKRSQFGVTIFEDVVLSPNAPVLATVRGISGGPLTASQVAGRAETVTGLCTGFVDVEPDHQIELTEFFDFLSLQVESPDDTVLVVRGPGGSWCNDDVSGFNPGLTGEWFSGVYDVWVGSYNADTYHPYVIRLTNVEAAN